jgi:hypothetical protein
VDTPTKKRKIAQEDTTGVQQSYAGAASGLAGVTPLGKQLQQQQQINISQVQRLLQQKPQPRQKKNICFGTSKTLSDGAKETLLAADVDLVASGVSKDCTNDNLKDFLKDKGIDVVAVETLTKDEVLPQVRTKTFKITVKAGQYEKALMPEVWPYRVAVRHFRAPKREGQGTWSEQSGRTGGRIGDQPGGRNGGRPLQQRPSAGQLPVGHPNQKTNPQQVMEHDSLGSIPLSNLYELLGHLGSLEIPTY